MTNQEKTIKTIEPIIQTLNYIKARAEAGYDDNPAIIALVTPTVDTSQDSAHGTFGMVGSSYVALSMMNDALCSLDDELVMQNLLIGRDVLKDHLSINTDDMDDFDFDEDDL